MRDASARKTKHDREPEANPAPGSGMAGLSPVFVLGLLSLVVVGATLFAHWPALTARALSFDDNEYLTANQLVRHPGLSSACRFVREVAEPSTVHGYYQPLTMISLMLDYAVAGRPDNLRPFHRTSLALHAANTVLVILLLYMLFPLTRRFPACREGPRNAASPPAHDTRRDFVALGRGAPVACQGPAADAACQGFGQPWVAAMVGLLFGVHPMTVEPIPWIGERKTLLAAFFALWCLIVYVRYARRPNWKLYLTCLVLYVLALMSKPTSTPLPVVMLLMDFWPLRRLSKQAVLEKLPFLAIAGLFSVITVVSQARTAIVRLPGEYPAARIPFILCHNIVFYLYKIVWPTRLSSHYPFPQPLNLSDPMVLAGVIGTCILIPALLISLRWTRALLTGWLVFFVAIFPTMGVLGFTIVIASDKFAYLPAIGLLMILAWLLGRAWSDGAGGAGRFRRVGMVGGVLVVASLLMAGTRGYLRLWQTEEALGNHMVALAPQAAAAYHYRGGAYYLKGDYDRAVLDCTKAIELESDFADAYNTRGLAHNGKGEHEQAIRDFTRAIELQPGDAEAYNGRAVACYKTGDYDRAIREWSRAIELKPDYAVACNSRGVAYCMKGEYAKAIQDYDRCIALAPDNASAYNNRGNAHLELGEYRDAVRDYTKAIEVKSDYAEAYGNRAAAYLHLKEYDKALGDVRRCQELGGKPDPDVVRQLMEAASRGE